VGLAEALFGSYCAKFCAEQVLNISGFLTPHRALCGDLLLLRQQKDVNDEPTLILLVLSS